MVFRQLTTRVTVDRDYGITLFDKGIQIVDGSFWRVSDSIFSNGPFICNTF